MFMQQRTTSFSFQVEGHTFHMSLSIDNAISFQIEIPYEKTPWYKDDAQWACWWEPDYEPSRGYSYTNYGIYVNPFTFLKELKKQVQRMISGNQLEFFYFKANDPKKLLMYKRLENELFETLPGWTVQRYESFVYFYKDTTALRIAS